MMFIKRYNNHSLAAAVAIESFECQIIIFFGRVVRYVATLNSLKSFLRGQAVTGINTRLQWEPRAIQLGLGAHRTSVAPAGD